MENLLGEDSFPLTTDRNLVFPLSNEDNNETECFRSTELEAVPSHVGQLVLIILYSLTSLAALVGNVTVIVVEVTGSESAHNIRKYLINLAVSDITIGVFCVPFAYTDFMLGRWIFAHWLCPTAQFVQLLSVFVTSLTLTAIGVERYFATLHPFSRTHHWLESHTHLMLSLTWVLGSVYAYMPVRTTATKPFELDNLTYYECSYDNNLSDGERRLFTTTNLILTFLLPLMVLIFSYSAIVSKLIANQRMFRANSVVTNNSRSLMQTSSVNLVTNQNECNPSFSSKSQSRSQSVKLNIPNKTSYNYNNKLILKNSCQVELRRTGPINHHSKTIKMMLMVILLYGLCWMPIKVYQLCVDYHVIEYCTQQQLHFFVSLYFACHWLAMANSFVNPIVYSFMSQSFRNDFRRITQYFRDGFANKLPHHHHHPTTSTATQV